MTDNITLTITCLFAALGWALAIYYHAMTSILREKTNILYRTNMLHREELENIISELGQMRPVFIAIEEKQANDNKSSTLC